MYKLTAAGTLKLSKEMDNVNKDPEIALLAYIQEAREPVNIDELVGEFRSTATVVETILARLENEGFIENTQK